MKDRLCPRCGSRNLVSLKTCGVCMTPLRQKRFHMDKNKISYVHVLALKQKGLTEEEYKLRLNAVGVESCKELKRDNYYKFVDGLRKLPDAPSTKKAA